MRKHPVLLCVSVCILLVGLAANAAALPSTAADPVVSDHPSTTLTVFCSTSLFDATSPPVLVVQNDNTAPLPDVQEPATITTVPEPSSVVLVLLGMGVLLGVIGLRRYAARTTR